MKVTDYITLFLVEKGITDVFGYPGGMITHFMDSLSKYKELISAHLNYHEQASSFCACWYGSVKRKPGIAYATSGPGATNLITGIANAYYDSLPSAIGAYYASKTPVISFNGDGVLQMNIQELQFISREQLPIKIIVLNNHSLGMIRHFQEMYFEGRYTQTILESTYTNPDFCKVASAYGIRNINISAIDEIRDLHEYFIDKEPLLIDVDCGEKTYVFPKLGMGKPTYDQEPPLKREILNNLLQGA